MVSPSYWAHPWQWQTSHCWQHPMDHASHCLTTPADAVVAAAEAAPSDVVALDAVVAADGSRTVRQAGSETGQATSRTKCRQNECSSGGRPAAATVEGGAGDGPCLIR